MGITTRSTTLQQVTEKQLKSVGIDFARTALSKGSVELSGRFEALYDRGIIYVNGNNKGEMLERYLRQINVKPFHVVYVDDKGKHVGSVQQTCEKLGIQFLGVRYTGADPIVANFDKNLADRELVAFLSESHTTSVQPFF